MSNTAKLQNSTPMSSNQSSITASASPQQATTAASTNTTSATSSTNTSTTATTSNLLTLHSNLQAKSSNPKQLPKSLTISSISNPSECITSPNHPQSLILSSPPSVLLTQKSENNHGDTHNYDENKQTTDTNSKIYEMNTYVQLEIDNNNSLCIPRTCKFTIKKLVLKRELIQQLLQTTSVTANMYQQLQQQQQQQQGQHHQSQLHQAQQQANSLIIAIKLNISKRILRTIELPLNKLIKSQQQLLNDNLIINLNLFYNISYSHYLKKNTNFLYIYIQRRKKYKNRTILGYKTLAFAKIDLQLIMQRTYNIDLLLETMTSQGLLAPTPLATPILPASVIQMSSNKYLNSIMLPIGGNYDVNQLQQQYGHQICGYLTIQSLNSQSFDYQTSDLEQQQQQHENNKKHHKSEIDDLDGDDDDIPTNIIATSSGGGSGAGNALTNVLATLKQNKALNTALNSLTNRSGNSDSDVEFDGGNTNILKIKRGSKRLTTLSNNSAVSSSNTNSSSTGSGNNKKFTGKLISFIRKLRINDDINNTVPAASVNANSASTSNSVSVNPTATGSANNTINEDDEQISDFSDNSIGSASDIEADLYSIISTPKPSLQPFFKPITTSNTTIATRTIVSNDDELKQYLINDTNDTVKQGEGVSDDEDGGNFDYMIDSNSDNEQLQHTFESIHQQQQQQQSPIKQQLVNKTGINSEQIMKNLDSLLHNSLTSTSSTIEIAYHLMCDSNFYMKLKDTLNNSYLLSLVDLQSSQQRDLRVLFETLINWFNMNKQQLLVIFNKKYQQYYYYSQQQQQQHQQQNNLIQIKLVLFGNDQFLNQFLQVYVDVFKTQDLLNLFKFYFIPYYSQSIPSGPGMASTLYLAKLLYQFDSYYQCLFGDEYWMQLDSSLQYYDVKEILQRIQRFIKYASQSYIQLQICEVMINISGNSTNQNLYQIHLHGENENVNESNANEASGGAGSGASTIATSLPPLFIPFICDVKIGGGSGVNSSISTSYTNDQLNELEQILTSSSPSHNNTKDDISPPNSPNPNDDVYNLDYDLQVDYWTLNQSLPSSASSSVSSALTSSLSMQNSQNIANSINNSTTSTSNMQQISQQQQQPQSQQIKDGQLSSSTSASSTTAKITKSTTKGLFKYLHIYRIPSVLINLLNSSITYSNLNAISSSYNSNANNLMLSPPQSSAAILQPNQCHLHQYGQDTSSTVAAQNLSMAYIIKEKKQKIMRLSKKSKEHDHKKDCIDGLTRLVCTSRTQDVPLKVFIDGIEWKNIKFFQISSQWHGHIKSLNLMFGSLNKNQMQTNTD